MFFNDFQHLSPNINDNLYILTEKFKKELRRGDKDRLEKLLAKKESRLDKLEAKKKKLVSIAHAPRIHPDDVAAGNAGIVLKDVVEKEYGHLRDIGQIKKALREQMLPKEGENTLDLDFQEKLKKKNEVRAEKIHHEIEDVDREAEQNEI